MTHFLAAACLLELVLVGWLVWSNRRESSARAEAFRDLLDRMERERDAHRKEVAALHQARMEETADLLQRIQAPEQAVTSHAADSAAPDPPPVNLADDLEMFELREQRLKDMGVIADG